MKIGLLSILLAVLVISLSNEVRAERYEVAASNYQNKKYDLAYEQFLDLAELGNKDAQYAIGLMYLNGFYVEADPNMAYAWVNLSGSQGNASYQEMAEKIWSTIPQADKAQAIFEVDSLELTHGDGVIYSKSMPQAADLTAGVFNAPEQLPNQNVSLRYPQAASRAGQFGSTIVYYLVADDGRVKYPEVDTSTGDIFNRPSLDAVKSLIYKPATAYDAPVTSYGLRYRFSFAMKHEKHVEQERLYALLADLKAKADAGGSVERYRYAKFASTLTHYLKPSQQSEFSNSFEYFAKAAIDGLPQAKFELGKSVLYRQQSKADAQASYFWLHRAAQGGIPEAQLMLGLEQVIGLRVDANLEKGIEWLETAAATYDPAKLELAVAIATQLEGEQRDLAKAKQLLGSINKKTFEDKVSFYEAQALVYSASGSEKELQRSLKKLKKEARKLKLPYDVLAQNIQRRLVGQPVVPLRS